MASPKAQHAIFSRSTRLVSLVKVFASKKDLNFCKTEEKIIFRKGGIIEGLKKRISYYFYVIPAKAGIQVKLVSQKWHL